MPRSKYPLTHLALASAAALASLAGNVQAQASSTPNPPPSGAAPAEAALPALVVKGAQTGRAEDGYRSRDAAIAGFSEQSLVDTPFSVKVLPSELLVNQNIENIGRLDRLDASVTSSAATPGSHSAPFIRGFALNNLTNFRYNGQSFINVQMTGLENKERIEILSGLSALQAGFASPGGIVNYVTKRPTRDALNAVDFTLDSHGDVKAGVDLSRRNQDGRFGLRVNAVGERLDSYVDGAKGDRGLISLAADWNILPGTDFQLDLEHQRRKQAQQPVLSLDSTGRLPTNVDPKTFLGQDWAEVESEYTMLSGRLDHALNDNWSLTAEANMARQERSGDFLVLGGLQPNGDAAVSDFYAPDQRFKPGAARLTAHGKFGTGPVAHDLTFGYSYTRWSANEPDALFEPIGATNIHAPVAIPKPALEVGPAYTYQRVTESGLFFNDVLSLGDAWKFHLGGRYAMRKDTSYDPTGAVAGTPYDKNVFTPSVAVVFKPAANISTYISYVEGLESGGTAPLGTVNQQEQMDPLTSKQFEVGVKAELGDMLAEASLFQIDRAAEYTDAGNVYVQEGNQRHRGLQLSLSGKVAREWTVFGSAMLLDAELEKTGNPVTEGKRPVGVPKYRVALVGEYRPSVLPGWAFNGNGSYTSDRMTNATNLGEAAPGYSVFGLGARFDTTVASTPVTLRVNVDNVTDKFYWANTLGGLVAGAPRTLTAGVSVKF